MISIIVQLGSIAAAETLKAGGESSQTNEIISAYALVLHHYFPEHVKHAKACRLRSR
jgi:hypothetical protein